MFKTYFESFWEENKIQRKVDILQMLESKTKKLTVLDCGCDDGEFSLKIAAKLNTSKILGIEINDMAILQATRKGIKVKKANLNYKFPFKSASLDVIIADQVIEHLWDLDNFISEIYRLLRPGGYAIISTENLASWHNVIALLLGLQPFSGPSPSTKKVIQFHPLTPDKLEMAKKHSNTPTMPDHTKVLTQKALVDLARLYDFVIEKQSGIGYFPFKTPISQLFSGIDIAHCFFITVKLRKN